MSSTESVTTHSADIKDYEVYLQTQEQSDVTVDDIKNMTFTYTNQDGDESDISLSDI